MYLYDIFPIIAESLFMKRAYEHGDAVLALLEPDPTLFVFHPEPYVNWEETHDCPHCICC